MSSCVRRADDSLKESGEIIGDVIDVWRLAPFQLPALAEHLARVLGHHQHGGHAERVRRLQIAREIFEHNGLGRIDGYRELASMIRDNFDVVPATGDPLLPANYVEFAYDWRLSNRISAKALKKLIADGLVEKLSGRPARYVATGDQA